MVQPQIFNIITSSLNQLGIRYSVDVSGESVVGQFSLREGQSGGVWFRVMVVMQTVVCYAGYTHTQIQRSWQMLNLIDLLNSRMLLGNFEFETVSAVLRYKYSVPWSALSDHAVETVQALVQVPVNMCDRCLPAITRVLGGANPVEAIRGI